jgi:starch phosphorylase
MRMKVKTPSFQDIPERISQLPEFSYNLWWSWHGDARELFRRLDRTLWRATPHNPVRILQEVAPERLERVAQDERFLALYDSVMNRFEQYMSPENTWFRDSYPKAKETCIAYFCAEFGIHNSLPIYSGGLGLLAGDTLKEASDLNLPMVGIGSLYPEGYFHQRIEADGRQEALYTRLETDSTALRQVVDDNGERFLVSVPLGDDEVKVAVWKVQVGRVPIFLMDTDIEENEVWLRDLSARLYAGDQFVRLRQEIVLGMGGVLVLRALGYEPDTCHLNEGHAAFAGLELLKEELDQGASFDQAISNVRSKIVFTTHTPVKAGHDEFPFHMMEEYFRGFWEKWDITREQLFGLGRLDDLPSFSMTVLALRMSRAANGVSRRHGEVSREMWQSNWPGKSVDEVPIQSITNGVHVPTWVAPELLEQYVRELGPYWKARHDDSAVWEKVLHLSDEELWAIHCRLKRKLLSFVRSRAQRKWAEGGVTSPSQMVALGTLLDPEALTIGFARRFATYKRATLVLHDQERLKRILKNPWRPVQIIFAGKAHPADEPGKFLLQQIVQAGESVDFAGHIAFVEDYDKHVAHHLVSGVDVWLNTPREPMEASGTSGQKASLNGVPNFSVRDGWWFEGYNGKNGWAIEGEDDPAAAESLYSILENEIVPLYYQRGPQGVPEAWVALMKEVIRSVSGAFSARRMMKEYTRLLYKPGSKV